MSPSPAPPRTADRLTDAMEAAGVRTLFSLSGNQIMPIYDALIDRPIRLVHTRHEAAAVFMAEAYARISGRIGVAMVTAGPGFGNALGALYSASQSETPVILISGDSPVASDGQGAFQEFDQVAAATPFVKASLRVPTGIDVAEVFAMATQVAQQGIPGPVHIGLPFDVVSEAMTEELLPDVGTLFNRGELSDIEPALLEPVSALITNANKPLIVCGPALGGARNRARLDALSVATGSPVSVLDSPRGLRDPAKGAFRTLLGTADCLVYLGKAVDFMTAMGDPDVVAASQIAIISDSQAALGHAADVYADRLALAERIHPSAALNALTAAATSQPRSSQDRAASERWRQQAIAALQHRALDDPGPNDLYSQQVIEIIATSITERPDTIVICDGGEIGQWAQGFIGVTDLITNGPSGAIGGSLPYAIGASLAQPDTPVLAIMGDGTAGFHFSEFETAARERLNITVVIGNDSKWNAEHNLQINQYGEDRTLGCELGRNIRYDISAAGLGCSGTYVTELNALDPALQEAASNVGPTCINVIIPGAAAPVYKPFRFE